MKSASITRTESSVIAKLRDIAVLFKLRLSLLVVVSAFLGYLMGIEQIVWPDVFILCLGGFLLTGGSNGLNQVWERHWDKLMLRTQNRPIPTERMGVTEGVVISSLAGAAGIISLWIGLGIACGLLALFAFVMYVFVYTPLKRVTGLAVFVGALPGAIPPMLGYVAGTGNYGLEAGLLYFLQFMWQFPHFWAIAWVAHDDYQRGGYKLLPFTEGRTRRTAFTILLYTLFLIPASLLPWALPLDAPMVGSWALMICVASGLTMTWFAVQLYIHTDMKYARRLMFASFLYLPVVQVIYVLDRL